MKDVIRACAIVLFSWLHTLVGLVITAIFLYPVWCRRWWLAVLLFLPVLGFVTWIVDALLDIVIFPVALLAIVCDSIWGWLKGRRGDRESLIDEGEWDTEEAEEPPTQLDAFPLTAREREMKGGTGDADV